MNHEVILKNYLSSDATLNSILTGGIYSWKETKRLGLSRKNTPLAYNNGFLKPTLVIKASQEIPTYRIPDADTQFLDSYVIAQLWFYDDGDSSFDAIELARGTVYLMLQDRRIEASFYSRLANSYDGGRDESMERAAWIRDDYQLYGNLG